VTARRSGQGVGDREIEPRPFTELTSRNALPRVTVALTGRDEQEISDRCLAAGCRAVMLKPVPVGELLRKSKEWLETQ